MIKTRIYLILVIFLCASCGRAHPTGQSLAFASDNLAEETADGSQLILEEPSSEARSQGDCPQGFFERKTLNGTTFCKLKLPISSTEIAEPYCSSVHLGSLGVYLLDKKSVCPAGFQSSPSGEGTYCTVSIPEKFRKDIRSDCSGYFKEGTLSFFNKELPKVAECPFENMTFDLKAKTCTLKVDVTKFSNQNSTPYCDYWDKSGYLGFAVDYPKNAILTGALVGPCPLPFREGHVWQRATNRLTLFCTLSDSTAAKSMKVVVCDPKSGLFTLQPR